MEVYWTDKALSQLDAIYEYIAQDVPIYALSVVDKITARSAQLSAFPQSGRAIPEYEDVELRELIEPPYRLLYRVNGERIDVIAIFHGAQRLPDRL